MKKVIEILGLRSTKGMFGIEIEAEGNNIRFVENDVWNTVDDGSLRGEFPESRAEFVLRKPLNMEHIEAALLNLKEEQEDAQFNFSVRTSVHVHVNVQQLTEQQLMSFIYSYLLVEELLVDYCGLSRKANRFCLRLQDAEGLMQGLQMLFMNGLAASKRYLNDDIRYAAINLAAIPKYGSVEFRSMRGTLDTNVLLTWVKALYNIRKFAVDMGSLEDILKFYNNSSHDEFLNAVVGNVAKEFKIGQWKKSLDRCYSLSLDIPHMYEMGAYKRIVEAPAEPLEF